MGTLYPVRWDRRIEYTGIPEYPVGDLDDTRFVGVDPLYSSERSIIVRKYREERGGRVPVLRMCTGDLLPSNRQQGYMYMAGWL